MARPSGDGGVTKMTYEAFIAARTGKIEVDQSLSVKVYYRMANNLLKQASVYRDEKNNLDLFILLLRYTSLLTDTIPCHRDYHFHPEYKVEYRKRLNQIINELEALKPEVRDQIEHMEFAHQNAGFAVQNSANTRISRSTSVRNQYYYNTDMHKDYGLSVSSSRREYLNRPSNTESPVFNPSYLNDFNSTSLSIPQAADDTLARHSVLGSAGQSIRRSSVRLSKVQYPSHIDATPTELPSLQKTLQSAKLSAGIHSLDSSLEAASSIWPKSETLFTTDPNLLSLLRQPSLPSGRAAVRTLPMVGHSNVQLRPSQVADPRPGPPRNSVSDFSVTKRRKNLHISSRMLEEFLRLADCNTKNNLETCGVLTGFLKRGVLHITTLIIPKQKSTPDTCETLNEEELFDIQEQRGLFQLGWIHTHPKQSCFMSSVDLHTHYSYQIMLPEAIAVVMAPTDTRRKCGIFRLSDPGVQVLQNCKGRGFHQHEEPLEGGPIYEDSSHVYWVNNVKYDIVDLR